jgi:RHS repeat-associated protein
MQRSIITVITLPNNQQYKFHYGTNHGLLDKITYPTGATVTYTWAANPQSEAIGFSNRAYPNSGASAVCQYRYDGFAIVKRVVSFDGSTSALEQDFSYTPTAWNANNPTYWISKQTVVTTRDLLRPGQPSYQTIYNYTPTPAQGQPNDFNSFPGQIPLESSMVYKDTNGSVLETVLKTWAAPNVLGSECVMLPNGQTLGTFYSYAGWAGGAIGADITDKKEYDYGQVASGTCTLPSSTPVRETTTAYKSFPATPSRGSIVDRPSSMKVYDHGALIAETDYSYDGTSVSGLSSLTGHDETNYSASYNNRGNLTTKTVKCFQTGCTDSITKYTYDETGQVMTVVDPNGNVSGGNPSQHTTNYSYADSYTSGGTPPGTTDGYLTKVTYPTVNGVTQTKNFPYDYASGQLNAATDPNSQTTTYTYNDPFRRPTLVNSPDGGQSEIAYNDTAPFPTVASCQLINGTAGATCSASTPASGWKTSMTKADGMGHAVQTQLASDPDGADFTDTTYDGLAQVWTRSNPHRLGSSSTDGTTTYYYDGLGRVCLVVPPDGTQPAGSTCPSTRPTGDVLTSYSNNCTTVTDEAGKARTSCSDGLGRLTAVFEDPSTLNYETDYTYDALNNLLTVNQKGGTTGSTQWRSRTFTYNSLSQLLCAANPEIALVTCPNPDNGSYTAGTVRYAYDNNGNMLTKTAPAPNQTGTATVTTTYAYDALNRLTQKSYSDGKTATVKYGYDGGAPSGCTPPTITSLVSDGISATPANQLGRRSSMCDAAGAAAWAYDAVGHPKLEPRVLGAANHETGYVYYLDGRPSRIFYPSGDGVYQWTTAAGRSNGVGDSANNYVFQNVTYAPNGAVTQTWQGSSSGGFAGILTPHVYDKRLQPVLEYAVVGGGSSQLLFQRCYDFHISGGVSISYGGVTCSFSGSTPGDNGNVYQIVNKMDDNRTQNFTYDVLNRIQSAYTNGPNWGEMYTIDAWGNLTNRAGVSGKNQYEPLSAPATTKNQLIGFGYDAAGNMTSNGTATYTYDAENRLISAGGMSYIYDGDGNRVEKCTAGTTPGTCATVATGTLHWTGAGSDVLDESDLSGNISEEYMFFNGQRVARVDRPSGTVHYYISDHLGSARIIATPNSSNTVTVEESDYYPYGGEIPISGSDPNHYKFTGKERDSESGLDNFGSRYDASALGRFMTPDSGADETLSVPVPYAELENPQSINLYSYVRNNPLRFTDPDGQNVQVCVDNGQGGQNCVNLTDDEYKSLYNQQNGQQGINLPGGSMPGGNITCGGQVCGSAHFYEPGLVEEGTGMVIGVAGGKVAGFALGRLFGAIGGMLGRGTGEALGGTAQGGAKVLLSGGTKQAAKDIVEGLADGAQKASAKRAVAAATRSESVSISQSADGTLAITRTRPGFDGFHVLRVAGLNARGQTPKGSSLRA